VSDWGAGWIGRQEGVDIKLSN